VNVGAEDAAALFPQRSHLARPSTAKPKSFHVFIPRLLLFARRCCPTSRRLRSIVGPIVAVLTAAAPAVAGPGTQTRFSLQQSIKAIPAGMVSSGALTSAELHRTIEFMVPLKMRNYEELVARL